VSDIHTDYQRIGSVLSRARERAGLTQQDIAEKLGRSKANISQIENGKAKTSLQFLMDYGRAVNVDVLLLLAAPEDEIGQLAIKLGRLLPTLSDDRLNTIATLVQIWSRPDNGG
jgi:transcriptional regulator with XRE-family HTH domain